jgi:hypothetical protein
MFRKTLLDWRFAVAILCIGAAVSVYLFARVSPPEILKPLAAPSNNQVAFTGVFDSAPSFFYTLGFGLIVGRFASNDLSAKIHCLVWIGMAVLLEVSQARFFAETIVDWLPNLLAERIWAIAAPYWIRGVFDPIDLVATVAGGIIALAILSHTPKATKHIHG